MYARIRDIVYNGLVVKRAVPVKALEYMPWDRKTDFISDLEGTCMRFTRFLPVSSFESA